ncbi:MAG: CU044_2847 family protein [Solirubrobacterales bacterium]
MNEQRVEERIVELTLPNGSTALARVTDISDAGAKKVGVLDKLDFDGVTETLRGVAEAVQAGLATVKPKRTKVEFGIELGVKNGALSGLLVEGEGRGSLVVTLEWDRQG